MKTLILSALLTGVCATGVVAQPQFAIPIIRDLRRAGVSDACISSLSSHDFAVLKGINESRRESSGQKLQRMAFKARQACGESASVLDMAIR
jgi:hypothetical protein